MSRRSVLVGAGIGTVAGLAGAACAMPPMDVGGRDLLTPPRLGRALAAAVPGARLVEVPGAGHMLPYEEPDLLAEIIVSAVTEREGAAS